MIILDTNVISELMRETPHEKVKQWISTQNPLQLALTTIAIAEIQRGLTRLSKGKRRTKLESHFSKFVSEAFSGRIFSFDENAALTYGSLAAQREAKGLHADPVDIMIASIAKNLGATIATRNTSDFEGCGLKLINPWQSSP